MTRPVIQVGPRGGRIVATRVGRDGHVVHEYERPGEAGAGRPAGEEAPAPRTVAVAPADWRDAFPAPPTGRHRPAVVAQLARVEDEIRGNKDREHGAGIGSDGRGIFHQPGMAKRVEITQEHRIRLLSDGNAVFTHNHPSGAVLSDSDIYMAAWCNLKEMRACVPRGAWVLRRPADGWPDWANDPDEGAIIHQVLDGAHWDAQKAHPHEWNRAISEAVVRRFNDAFHERGIRIEWEPTAVASREAAAGGPAVYPGRGLAPTAPERPAPRTLTLAPSAAPGPSARARPPRVVALERAGQQRLL